MPIVWCREKGPGTQSQIIWIWVFAFPIFYLCGLGKSLILSELQFVPLDKENHSSQDWWNYVNHAWRVEALGSTLKHVPKYPCAYVHTRFHQREVLLLSKVRWKSLFVSIGHWWTLPHGALKITFFKCHLVVKPHVVCKTHALFEKRHDHIMNLLNTQSLFFTNHWERVYASEYRRRGRNFKKWWKNTKETVVYLFVLENMRPSGITQDFYFYQTWLFRHLPGNTRFPSA